MGELSHPMSHNCLNCNKPITWTFGICSDCKEIYGSHTKWPEWFKYLWTDTKGRKRKDKKINDYEIYEFELINEKKF